MAKINSSHIAIPTILKVEDGALSKIGPYLQENNLQKVVIYFGNGLIDMFGQKVLSSLHNAGIEVLEYCELDTVDIDDIIRIAFALPNSTQAVIWAVAKSLMPPNIWDFCVSFPSSACRLLLPVMAFPAPALPCLLIKGAALFPHVWLMALL